MEPIQQETTTLQYRESQILFTGKKAEYFRIWIVNLFLSIVTLGIYGAWAKVRNTQYLYGHTKAEGHSLRYLATPMQILKGRLIAFVFFSLYILSSSFNPLLGAVFAILLLIASPWLMVQGLRFTLQHTSYRNVRFSFTGTYGGAFLHIYILPLLGTLTGYLLMPWVLQKIDLYIRGNVTYGGKPFDLKTSAGPYYLASIIALGLGIAIAVGGVALIAAMSGNLDGTVAMTERPSFGSAIGLFTLFFYFVGFALIRAIYKAIIRNHVMNNLSIENTAAFKSSVKILPYSWILVTNALLIVCTLGLAFPITVIRKNQYLASATQIQLTEQADNLVDEVNANPSAFGEEAADLFDLDLSLT